MTTKQALILGIVLGLAALAVAIISSKEPEPPFPSTVRVVLASEVEWGHLNPLRGDKSPRAGTLWGSRQTPVPSGFLVKFVDGFSSPPHIHPVTYRGVVVSGEVHNDLPTAAEEWLPAGSFWTQPAGEVHITAARGSENVAYIEIEKGPYLVKPVEDAFEPDEKPVKLAPSTMDWAAPPGLTASADGPKVAALPGNPHDEKLRRAMVKLPPGFEGAIRSQGSPLHAVVIQGSPRHEVPDETKSRVLEAGSYFGSEGKVAHRVACDAGEGCLLYVRTMGAFDVLVGPAE